MPRASLVAITLWAAAGAAPSLSAQPSHPNVVFIMTDDAGYGDFGVYGAADVETPNIDRLAMEGARFTDFYANGPVCTPTRVGLMTGRYQQRLGLERPVPNARQTEEGGLLANGLGLVANGRTLPQLLKDNGYATGLVGKWHLGYEIDQSPSAHGFDHFFGFKSGFVDSYRHTNHTGAEDLWENERPVRVEGYLTDLITQRSTAFIRENADQPFFLSVQFNAPHWPFQPPDLPLAARDQKPFHPYAENTSTRREYVAMLERVDQGVGTIVQSLDAAGVRERTLVIFTNDNGGEWLSRSGPLFHQKWTVWEGGIRVPAIMCWPGVIPAGLVTDQVGITMDFTATILAATGAQVPSDLDLEGIDLLPILEGEAPELQRTLFWRAKWRRQRAVRSGEWKLLIDSGTAFVFNVGSDLGERHDVASIRQDVARRLHLLLQEWEADVDAEAEAGGHLQ